MISIWTVLSVIFGLVLCYMPYINIKLNFCCNHLMTYPVNATSRSTNSACLYVLCQVGERALTRYHKHTPTHPHPTQLFVESVNNKRLWKSRALNMRFCCVCVRAVTAMRTACGSWHHGRVNRFRTKRTLRSPTTKEVCLGITKVCT